jgi:hypothetical protein
MEEGLCLDVVGGSRDCGVLLGVCLGGISSVCLSFTGCTAIFHKLWKITKRSHNKLLHNWFSYCGVSMQIAGKSIIPTLDGKGWRGCFAQIDQSNMV